MMNATCFVVRSTSALLALAVLSSLATGAQAQPRDLQRDVEGYAIAVCLAGQESEEIRRQGEGWASVIVNEGYGNVEDWEELIAAVRDAVASEPMAAVKGDGPENGYDIPVYGCWNITTRPQVTAAIASTMVKMAPAYEGR